MKFNVNSFKFKVKWNIIEERIWRWNRSRKVGKWWTPQQQIPCELLIGDWTCFMFFLHMCKKHAKKKKKNPTYTVRNQGVNYKTKVFFSSSICKTPIHQTCRKKKRWVIYKTSSSLWFGVITSRGGKKFEVENQNRTFE